MLLLLLASVILSLYLTDHLKLLGDILQKRESYTVDDLEQEFFWVILLRVGYMICDPITAYHTRMLAMDWRKAITREYLRRYERVRGHLGLDGVSQRLQEEPYKFTLFLEAFGSQILRSVMSLIVFLPLLAQYSPIIHVDWNGLDLELRGSLVYLVVILALIGLCVSVLLGKEFPAIENTNRTLEAEFRNDLVLVEEGEESIDSAPHQVTFCRIYKSYRRMFRRFILLDGWFSCYWNIMHFIPIWLTAKWVFAGTATWGSVGQVTNVFMETITSLSVIMNNWRGLVDFIATYRRLHELETALTLREDDILTDEGLAGGVQREVGFVPLP